MKRKEVIDAVKERAAQDDSFFREFVVEMMFKMADKVEALEKWSLVYKLGGTLLFTLVLAIVFKMAGLKE